MIRKYRRINSRPAVGGDVLGSKFDLQKALAWKKKIGSTQSHLEWPPLQGGLVGVATALSPATCRPFQVFSPSFFVGLGLDESAWNNRSISVLIYSTTTVNPLETFGRHLIPLARLPVFKESYLTISVDLLFEISFGLVSKSLWL